jgi:hypothetical protein
VSDATKQQDLTWRGIELFNQIVLELSFKEAVETFGVLREHLEARAHQCRPEEANTWE